MRRVHGSGGFVQRGTVVGLLAILAVLSLAGCGGNAPPKVTEFKPESEAFTCDLPGSPTVSTETINTPSGAIEVKTYTVVKSDIEYAVKDGALPAGLKDDAALDAARDETVKSSGGKLLNEAKLILGEVPGRELTIEIGDGLYLHTRLYAVKGRLLQSSVKLKSKFLSPVANKFISSVKWVKDAPPVPTPEVTPPSDTGAETK